MKFKIITLGCKVNTYESEFIKESLIKAGYIPSNENPNIIIINTCSVTNTADSKSLKLVRRAKREYPDALFVVCGCSSQNNFAKYEDLDINILLGNKDKSKIVEIINNYLTTKTKYSYHNQSRNLPFEPMTVEKFNSHTRAFIKIQDGCDNFCSYCIIPYTRGSIRSKPFDDVIKEAKTLVSNNHHEIVLTGINTGSYLDTNHDLSDLLTELSKIENLKRIRISSIEITELNSKFLNVLKTTPKIVNHLHIPLQSGSDAVLIRMNRKYDTAYFESKIKEIKSIRPNISITTDAIVGHPYETDEDFLDYLKFCKRIGFSKIHVFPYSKRAKTPSSFMPQINDIIKKERTKELINLSNILETNYYNLFKDKEVEVLTEEYYQNYTIGFTSNYIKVYIPKKYKLNTFYKCVIDKVCEDKVYAHVKEVIANK